jgi:hypothetical protein
MSENTQIPAVQKPAENASEAAYSNANWQSDFDALNTIQYILYLMSVPQEQRTWSDAIQAFLDEITHCCNDIARNVALCDPYLGLNTSEAATYSNAVKRVTSIAEPLLLSPVPDDPTQSKIQEDLHDILGVCGS